MDECDTKIDLLKYMWDSDLYSMPCCVLEQDTLLPESTG